MSPSASSVLRLIASLNSVGGTRALRSLMISSALSSRLISATDELLTAAELAIKAAAKETCPGRGRVLINVRIEGLPPTAGLRWTSFSGIFHGATHVTAASPMTSKNCGDVCWALNR
jgi:hypothetical protein